jgi:hypothetical protein
VGAEGVGVVDRPHLDLVLHLAQQALDGGRVGNGVGGVGQHDGRVPELPEGTPQRPGGRVLVGERRVALGQLLGPGVLHDRLPAPVHRQPFQEVVPLDVAVVVARRRIRRVKVDEVPGLRREGEHVAAGRHARLAAVKNHAVVLGGAFAEMLPQRYPQVPAAVVVPHAGDGENAARLAAGGRQDQRGDGDVAPVPGHAVNVGPGRIEKCPVRRGEVQPGERALDKIAVIGGRPADQFDVLEREPLVLVGHRRAGNDRGKREEIVRGDPIPKGLEQVGHHSAAGEGIQRCRPADFGEYLRQMAGQPVLRPHVPQPREVTDATDIGSGPGPLACGHPGSHTRHPCAPGRPNLGRCPVCRTSAAGPSYDRA